MNAEFVNKQGMRVIDQSAPSERVAVMRPCNSCGRDVAVANDYTGVILCSESCKKTRENSEAKVGDVLIRWANSEPTFYQSAYNVERIVTYFREHGWGQNDFTVANLKQAFADLTAQKKLLPVITQADIARMSAEEYAERLRLDPEMGGLKSKIDAGELLTPTNQRRPVESATPGFEPGNRVSALQAAAARELKERAASQANRYETVSYVNGMPVKAPELQGFQYRNGRLVR